MHRRNFDPEENLDPHFMVNNSHLDITLSSAATLTIQSYTVLETQSTGIEDSSDSLQRITNSGLVPMRVMQAVVNRYNKSVREQRNRTRSE